MTEGGERLLSIGSVQALTRETLPGLAPGKLGSFLGLSGGGPYPGTFNYGWATSHEDRMEGEGVEIPSHQHRVQNWWGGYAGTQVRFYPTNDSYILTGIQVMDHTFTGTLDKVLNQPLFAAFLGSWQ